MALTTVGRMPSPTVERVNQLRALAAAWQIEDSLDENGAA
jgi:hypothetical protein